MFNPLGTLLLAKIPFDSTVSFVSTHTFLHHAKHEKNAYLSFQFVLPLIQSFKSPI